MKKMIKNYAHNVIRLRKGKPSISQVYWIIVILNKNKTSSHKQVEQLGFFKHGKEKLFSINYQRLAYYLNKGYKLKDSVKKYIYWHSIIFNKYYKNKKKIKKLYHFMFQKKNIIKKKKIDKKYIDIFSAFKNYCKVVNKDLKEKVKKINDLAKEKALIKTQKRDLKQKELFLKAYAKKHKISLNRVPSYLYKAKPPIEPKLISKKDIRVNINIKNYKHVFPY